MLRRAAASSPSQTLVSDAEFVAMGSKRTFAARAIRFGHGERSGLSGQSTTPDLAVPRRRARRSPKRAPLIGTLPRGSLSGRTRAFSRRWSPCSPADPCFGANATARATRSWAPFRAGSALCLAAPECPGRQGGRQAGARPRPRRARGRPASFLAGRSDGSRHRQPSAEQRWSPDFGASAQQPSERAADRSCAADDDRAACRASRPGAGR